MNGCNPGESQHSLQSIVESEEYVSVEIITYHTDPRSIITLVLGYDVVEEEWGRLAYIDGFDVSASLDGSHLYHINSHILSIV